MDACRFAASSLIIFAMVSCGRKDDSQDLERYLKNFSLSIVDGTGKRVVGAGPNQISPTEVIIYNEEWEETGYSFIEVCDVGAFDLDFYLNRPNPRYLASDYYDLFYVSLGDDVDTLILSFGEKVEVHYTDPVLATTDYFPTTFQYNNFVLSELAANASDCESFILYK